MLSERLKHLRTEKDLTQEQMAKILGITRQAYGNYESGKREPDFATIRKLADFFNVSVDYLLGDTDLPNLERDNYYTQYRPKYPISLGELIKNSRVRKNLSIHDLANITNIDYDRIKLFERGLAKPSKQEVLKLSNALDIILNILLVKAGHPSTLSEFIKQNQNESNIDLLNLFEDNTKNLSIAGKPINEKERLLILEAISKPSNINTYKTPTVPILGTIKAGIPILSEENYDGELEIPSDMDGDFAVEVRGDSMIGAGINPGDYIICKKDVSPYNKDIVAAVLEGRVTLKYFIENNGKPILRSANPEYKDITIDENSRVQGVMVGLIRKEATPYHRYQEYISTKEDNLQDWNEIIEMAVTNGISPTFVREFVVNQIEIIKKFFLKN